MSKNDKSGVAAILISGLVVGFILGAITASVIDEWGKTIIYDSVLDDVCRQLTGNESVVSVDEPSYKKLICETVTFDATQNIIVRPNSKG